MADPDTHREPAVVAVARVGMHAESELADIELQGFVLITNVQSDYSDTLIHATSGFCGAPFVAPASCRRFSETAEVRSGRCAALT